MYCHGNLIEAAKPKPHLELGLMELHLASYSERGWLCKPKIDSACFVATPVFPVGF